MQAPFPLYVDELSPDKIKATVSNPNSLFYNLSVLKSLTKDTLTEYIGERISGVSIIPMGRFICMLVGSAGNRSMVFLDLGDKEELAGKIAEKLGSPQLHARFMEVYYDILFHPENHDKCELVVGKAKGLFK